MTDDPGCAIVVVAGFLGLLGLLISGVVAAAMAHEWVLLAVSAGLLVAFATMLAFGHERQPRERREVQKGARWP